MDINTKLYGVTELKVKDALRTMDIKERIDALTEAEAKAALKWCLDYAAEHTCCDECYEPSCEKIRKVSKKNVCQYVILRSALKAKECIA